MRNAANFLTFALLLTCIVLAFGLLGLKAIVP